MLWIKEVAMADSVDDSFKVKFNSEFRDAGCEDCVCSEPDHPEFLLQEEGQTKAQKEDR